MTYQVVIKRDGDAPENEGGVIASFVTRECATQSAHTLTECGIIGILY